MKPRSPNGLDRTLSRNELQIEADRLATRVLRVRSSVEAFDRLDRGDLAGTAIEAELKMLRHFMRA